MSNYKRKYFEKTYKLYDEEKDEFNLIKTKVIIERSKIMKKYDGRLVSDPTIKTQERKSDGQKFPMAYFSIAKTGKNGETIYISCRATGKIAKEVKELNKGDNIQIEGENKEYTTKTGEVKKYVQVNSVEVINKSQDKFITGNVVSDPKIEERSNLKTGEVFKVANFSIAENTEEGTNYTNCQAVGKEVEQIEKLLKGDYIKVGGKINSYIFTKENQEVSKEYLEVKSVKFLKAKEQEKGSFVKEMKELDKQAKSEKESIDKTQTKDMGQEI